jgi:tetratricopeptide (TPR) repeat protein
MLKSATGLALALAASALAQQHDHSAAPQDTAPAPLLVGLGHLHRPISTSNPTVQRYFDQGLTLIYGFNYDEALRSLGYATTLDPKCAMLYWGIALAQGPNYNEWVIDPAREKMAAESIQKAVALAAGATRAEQAYIRALAQRFSADPKADQTKLGEGYRDAMRELMRSNPNDLDAAILFADAQMDLHAWNLWKRDGTPEMGTLEAEHALESVLQRDPNNIGANHFYIHVMEGSPHPEQAMQSAQRMAGLAPGIGHLVHMPAHIYIRTGQYHNATVSNQQAIGADEGYIAKYHVSDSSMYKMMLYTHNMHFLVVTASLEGDFPQANRVALKMVRGMPATLRQLPDSDGFLTTPALVLVRFRRWAEIEQLPEPDRHRPVLHGVWRFARGMAFSGEGKLDQAAQERAAFASEVKSVPADTPFGYNSAPQIFQIAGWMLDASIARATHDYTHAAALLNKAALAEDALKYDEPPDWYLPPRESLGAVLLQAGRTSEAEAAFRQEIRQHARNPRALFGLAECLHAQGKADEEAAVRKQFDDGWKRSAVRLRVEDL